MNMSSVRYYLENREKILKRNRTYYQTHKEKKLKYAKEYRDMHKENINAYAEQYRSTHKIELKKYKQSDKYRHLRKLSDSRYRKTDKGKIRGIKSTTKRKRNLQWFLMFENPFDEPVDYHHITDAYVVALPRDLHKLYLGKYHRENTMEIVKQLYLGD